MKWRLTILEGVSKKGVFIERHPRFTEFRADSLEAAIKQVEDQYFRPNDIITPDPFMEKTVDQRTWIRLRTNTYQRTTMIFRLKMVED